MSFPFTLKLSRDVGVLDANSKKEVIKILYRSLKECDCEDIRITEDKITFNGPIGNSHWNPMKNFMVLGSGKFILAGDSGDVIITYFFSDYLTITLLAVFIVVFTIISKSFYAPFFGIFLLWLHWGLMVNLNRSYFSNLVDSILDGLTCKNNASTGA